MANLSAPTVRWVLFGFDGRIGRHSFILGQLLMISLFAVVVARIVAVQNSEEQLALWGLAFLALGLVSAFSMIAMTVKRLHDIGAPGILALVLFVPTVNIISVIVLMILPSSPQTNQYGPPPFGGNDDQ